MPYRKITLAVGETYHIFNHSLHDIPIFKGEREINNFLKAMEFYLASAPPVKFSIYRQSKESHLIDLSDSLVKIVAYCLMPTHFHFVLFQNKDKGIKTYLQKLTNSYSHYFNFKNKRKGSLFESPFKAVRVETEEQLLHLSRYVHLNPVTAYLVEHPKDYLYSSFPTYLGEKHPLPIETSTVLSSFSSPRDYEKFVLAQKDYQRKLEEIKHLLLEEY